MQTMFENKNGTLIVHLKGDIDHHTSAAIRQAVDTQIGKKLPEILMLDFGDVKFMDSSGVGLIMGRYKLARAYNCRVHVCRVPEYAERIMNMSGLGKLITFEKD